MKQLIFAIIVLVSCQPKEPQGCTTDFSRSSDQEYKNIVETPPINGEKYFVSSSKQGSSKIQVSLI